MQRCFFSEQRLHRSEIAGQAGSLNLGTALPLRGSNRSFRKSTSVF